MGTYSSSAGDDIILLGTLPAGGGIGSDSYDPLLNLSRYVDLPLPLGHFALLKTHNISRS